MLKGIRSATLSISIPVKAFSLSRYLNMYSNGYTIKGAPFVLFIQDLKKKYISELNIAERKSNNSPLFHKRQFKIQRWANITPHCSCRFDAVQAVVLHCGVVVIPRCTQWFLNRPLLCLSWKVLHMNLFWELFGNHQFKQLYQSISKWPDS